MKKRKPMLVLLRGLVRDSRHWELFPKALRQQLPEYLIVTPDIAGNGTRYRETSADSIEEMVEDLRSQLPTDQPLFLIAISMGGMVATQWASCYPDQVMGMVLINTSFKNISPLYQRIRLRWFPLLIKHFLFSSQHKAREQLILKMTSNCHRHDPLLVGRWSDYARQYPVTAANALRQLRAAAGFLCPITSPTVYTLLICGAKDRLVDPRCSEAIAEHWHCPLLTHPDAGHDLPLDDPDWLAATIAQFFADTIN